MNIYLLTQQENVGYDTYDSMIVAAQDEKSAVLIHPSEYVWNDTTKHWHYDYGNRSPVRYDNGWATTPENVVCKVIGTATDGTEEGIILASFNAG